MLKTIYKYPIQTKNVNSFVYLPLNAEILSAALVRNTICIYALVDPTETSTKEHKVFIFGTGQPISDEVQEQIRENGIFLNTIVEDDDAFGQLVWHVCIEG